MNLVLIMLSGFLLVSIWAMLMMRSKLEEMRLMLHDREEALVKALQIRKEILNHLEHEGHTPITAISGMSQTLAENYDKLGDARIKESLKIIAASSNRILTLVDNLINIAKLSKIDYQLDKEEVNLSKLIHNRLGYCKRLHLDSKNIEFITEIEEDVILQGSLHHLSSTIDSLIINAIKYSKKDKQEDKPKIVISLARRAAKVEFSITDQGVGIPKEELVTIFDPFMVGSRTRTSSGKIPNGQCGIGLTLCKLAIEAHNGKIRVKSDGEEGTKFSFTLPSGS